MGPKVSSLEKVLRPFVLCVRKVQEEVLEESFEGMEKPLKGLRTREKLSEGRSSLMVEAL